MPSPGSGQDGAFEILPPGNDFLLPVNDGEYFTYPNEVFDSLDICDKSRQLVVDFSALLIFENTEGGDVTSWNLGLVDGNGAALVDFNTLATVTNDRVRLDSLILLATDGGGIDHSRAFIKISDLPPDGTPATEITKFHLEAGFEWPEDGKVFIRVGTVDASATITVNKANGYFDRLEIQA